MPISPNDAVLARVVDGLRLRLPLPLRLARQLLLGLLVAVRDELVEEAAGLALLVAVFLGVLDLLLQVGVRFVVGFVGGVVG